MYNLQLLLLRGADVISDGGAYVCSAARRLPARRLRRERVSLCPLSSHSLTEALRPYTCGCQLIGAALRLQHRHTLSAYGLSARVCVCVLCVI